MAALHPYPLQHNEHSYYNMAIEDLTLTTGADAETPATVDAGSQGEGLVVVEGLVPSSPSAALDSSVIAASPTPADDQTTPAAATAAGADILDTVEECVKRFPPHG